MDTMSTTLSTTGISRRALVGGATVIGTAAALGATAQIGAARGDEAPAGIAYYNGSGTGRRGAILVKVGLSGTTIVSVEIVKHNETPLIASTALTRIPQLIVKNQSLDIDAVTGATITSMGIVLAVDNALAQAGLSRNDLAQTGTDTGIQVEEPIEADIAVVGAGLTGLVAAVRALQLGKKVVVFEETAHVGGSSCVSDGWITGADTIMERAEGTEDSADQLYDFLSKGGDDPSIVPYPEITRRFAEMSGPVLDWLDTYVNVDFGDRTGGYGLYVAPDQPRIYGVNNGGHTMDLNLLEMIQPEIANGNCSLILEARVTKIMQDDSGAVSGVEVTYLDGTVREYPFKAVICATGGYSHNQDMMPYTNCGSCSPSTASGHGWELIEATGAQMLAPEIYSPYAGGIPNAGFEMRYQCNLNMPGIIWVNQEGARIGNEDQPLTAKSLWGSISDNIGYIVFSEAQRNEEAGVRPIKLTSYLEGELTPWQSWDLLDSLVEAGQLAWKSDDAAELAAAAGIDADAFAQTVSNYNAYCDEGSDPDFGRENLQKLEGTLYAIKTIPYQLQTSGGARIDVDAAVLDANDDPIPGLYAGGEAIGMKQSTAGGQGGGALGTAATWGYIAADSACSYVEG